MSDPSLFPSKDLLSTLRDYERGGWVGSALAGKAAEEIERLNRELDGAADEIAKLTTERNVARAAHEPPAEQRTLCNGEQQIELHGEVVPCPGCADCGLAPKIDRTLPSVWLYLLAAARQLVEKVDQNHDQKEPPLKWNVPWANVTALRDAVLKAGMEYDRAGQPPPPEQPAPVRACRLVLDLQADSRDDLVRTLEDIVCRIDRKELTTGCSGGYNSGYTHEYTENDGPSHDEYAQQLKDHLAASRPTKGEGQ